MSTITTDIVAKLWNLCNILKDDGVTYHQYVIELTYLLFLKMAHELTRPPYRMRVPSCSDAGSRDRMNDCISSASAAVADTPVPIAHTGS